MTHRVLLMVGTALVLAGCDVPSGPAADGTLAVVPENVLAIAAPYQNLNAVRYGPNDECFHYRHEGPVETTWLPLRTVNGNPICAKRAEA